MTVVVLTTVGLIFAALVAAFALTWRRHASGPGPVEAEIEGPSCYPRVKR